MLFHWSVSDIKSLLSIQANFMFCEYSPFFLRFLETIPSDLIIVDIPVTLVPELFQFYSKV